MDKIGGKNLLGETELNVLYKIMDDKYDHDDYFGFLIRISTDI